MPSGAVMAPPSSSATGQGAAGSASGSTGDSDRPRPPRKLNRSSNQLHRNQACLPCRRRRIKCDAMKPFCSSCVRSFRFLQRTQPDPEREAKGIQCQYEDSHEADGSDGDMRVGDEDPRTHVSKLEARIAELQGALARLTSPSAAAGSSQRMYAPDGRWHGVPQTDILQQGYGMGDDTYMGSFNAIPPMAPEPSLMHGGLPVGDAMTGFVDMSMGSMGPLPHRAAAVPVTSRSNSLPGPQPTVQEVPDENLSKLLWPGWPAHLPTPEVLDHMCQTFFTVVPSISRILHRATFMARLALPPQHSSFPHRALLHAICAVTGRYTAAVHTLSVEEALRQNNEEIVNGTSIPSTLNADEYAQVQPCFAERHAYFAFLETRNVPLVGRPLLEVAQAMTVLSVYYQQAAKWLEGWMMTGACIRLATPLGILVDNLGSTRPNNSLLNAPESEVEREERRLLMAYMMTVDFANSATSSWQFALAHDELLARLPAGREDFDRGIGIPENPQAFYSPDLYTYHPVADSFVLFVKGVHVLGSVLKFVRKAQSMENPQSMKETPLFRVLADDVSAYGVNFPPELRDPLQPTSSHRGIDGDLVNAHLLAHVTAIKLHEMFADFANPRDHAANVVLAEARASLSLMCMMMSTNADFTCVLTPVTSFLLFVASRTFVVLYRQSLGVRDMTAAMGFLREVDVFRLCFTNMSHRYPMAARHGGMIDQMLEDTHTEYGIHPDSLRLSGFNADSLKTNPWRHLPHPYNEPTAGYHLADRLRRGPVVDPATSVPGHNTASPSALALNSPSNALYMLNTTPTGTSASLRDYVPGAERFFSPHSSPASRSSSDGTSLPGAVSVSAPTSATAPLPPSRLHVRVQHPSSAPLYPAPPPPPQHYSVPRTGAIADTQAAWLQSVSSATLPAQGHGPHYHYPNPNAHHGRPHEDEHYQ